MTTVRFIVDDVDAAVSFDVQHLGFESATRMGTAFAIVAKDDLKLWIRGPGGKQILAEDPSGNPIEAQF